MTLLTAILAVLAVAEMQNLLRAKNIATSALVYGFPILYLWAVHEGAALLALQLIVALCTLLLARQLITFPRFCLTDVGANLLAVIYPTILFANLLLLRKEAGAVWALAAVVGVWAYDSFAYVFGVQFGRLRPWRDISPKKSIEGAAGGLLGSVLVFVFVHSHLRLTLLGAIIMGMLVGGVGQLGDLAESALKRYGGVKDSGTLLPGHGGVLDRFDSLLFAATAVYWVWTAMAL
jgi:phosphatidate cytidylyltransferase